MGVKYLWDTNTAIYYLHRQFPPNAEKFIDNTLSESAPAISLITEIELLCWETRSEKDFAILQSFIQDSLLIEIDSDIKIKTVEIRKSYKVKLPDAIIAATAVVNNLTLLTRNISDFKNIKGLNLINPFDQ